MSSVFRTPHNVSTFGVSGNSVITTSQTEVVNGLASSFALIYTPNAERLHLNATSRDEEYNVAFTMGELLTSL
jgi:hypothetical protein